MSEERESGLSLADPTPLGFGAFAAAVFLAGIYLTGWVGDWQWLSIPFLYGGLLLLLTGMWEFSNRSTFGATAFSLYGAIALSLATLGIYSLTGHNRFADPQTVLGWSVASIAALNLFLLAGSLRTSVASALTFLGLEVMEVALAVGYFGQSTTWQTVAGYAALVSGVLAFYTCAAGVINRMSEREVLPVGSPIWGIRTDLDRPGSPVPRLELPLHHRAR